ncbi:MAG: hypothetical protein CMP51_02285 [Flavobacteriales bacterium]|nr:hypothetical protein [Flavobacteriales bacterium]
MRNFSKIIFTISLISVMFFSCNKEKDTIGIIRVVYSNGNPMVNAKVVLDQLNGAPGTDPISGLRKESTTDARGEATFTYTYEAILDVNVTKTSGNNNYVGNNVIRLLRGETTILEVEALIQ